jgi:hypothetical protein
MRPKALRAWDALVCFRSGVTSEIAIYRQQFTVPLREELNSARFEVIHRACNLDAAGGFEIP